MAALLACDPNEIVFAVDPSKKTLQTFVTVRNTSEEAHVAFSVKTTQPKLYAVRPPQGVLGPRQSVSVTVLMSNRKPPATLGLQKQDKFLFQFGEVPAGTTDEAAKDVLKSADGANANGLKLRVRLKEPPRAPSTISESLNEGHAQGSDEPGTPSSKQFGASVARNNASNSGDYGAPPSPMGRRAEEAAELRDLVGNLRREKDELQQSTEQLRVYNGVSGNSKMTTSDKIASARGGSDGFSFAQLVTTVVLALFLGILSRFVDRDRLFEAVRALLGKVF